MRFGLWYVISKHAPFESPPTCFHTNIKTLTYHPISFQKKISRSFSFWVTAPKVVDSLRWNFSRRKIIFFSFFIEERGKVCPKQHMPTIIYKHCGSSSNETTMGDIISNNLQVTVIMWDIYAMTIISLFSSFICFKKWVKKFFFTLDVQAWNENSSKFFYFLTTIKRSFFQEADWMLRSFSLPLGANKDFF